MVQKLKKNASCNLPCKDLSLSFTVKCKELVSGGVSSDSISNQDERDCINICLHDVTSILLETVLPWKRVILGSLLPNLIFFILTLSLYFSPPSSIRNFTLRVHDERERERERTPMPYVCS